MHVILKLKGRLGNQKLARLETSKSSSPSWSSSIFSCAAWILAANFGSCSFSCWASEASVGIGQIDFRG